jgi:type IV pilus assembly protein PilQ
MRALLIAMIVLGAAPARADRDLCGPGAKHRGTPIDLDLKAAEIHDVFRMLADTGHVNLVVADDVAGKVTLRLERVPWDQVACTVAAVHHLRITVRDAILLVMRATDRPQGVSAR